MSVNAIYAARPFNSAHCIRLLTILSARTRISCTLTNHSLLSRLQYTALSYTWGDPLPLLATIQNSIPTPSRPAKFITIDNVEFQVEENLFAAISSLVALGACGPFWIDAICINQKDEVEKAAQVAMMGDIYARASEVIAWLGPESILDSGAPQLHNNFIPALRMHLGDDFSNPAILKGLDLNQLINLGLLPDQQVLQSYHAFRHRAWFERAWIFQEALLSSHLRFLYATTFIERRNVNDMSIFDLSCHPSVSAAMGTLSSPYTSLRTLQLFRAAFELDTPTEANKKLTNIRDRETIKEVVQQSKSIWHPVLTPSSVPSILDASTIRARYLFHFVNVLRYRQCTDLRDKVYAAVGAINRLIPPKCDADLFNVQYKNTSVESVYIKFATWILERDPQMSILSYVEDPSERRLHDLPSWVPDLSVTTEISELIGQRTSLEDCVRTSAAYYLLTRTVSGHKLFTLANCLGEVVAVDPVPISDQLSNASCSLHGLFSFCDDMVPQYFNGQDRMEAIWRTLITDKDYSVDSRMSGQYAPPVEEDMAAAFRSYVILKLAKCLLNAMKAQPSQPANMIQENSVSTNASVMDVFMAEHILLLDKLAGSTLPSVSEFISGFQEIENTLSPAAMGSHAEPNNVEYRASRYARSLQVSGRRLYRTNHGHVGLAPRSTSVGDKVYQIQATRLPFMLRPQEASDGMETFSIVGEAYLHGIMDQIADAMDGSPDFTSSQIVLI